MHPVSPNSSACPQCGRTVASGEIHVCRTQAGVTFDAADRERPAQTTHTTQPQPRAMRAAAGARHG